MNDRTNTLTYPDLARGGVTTPEQRNKVLRLSLIHISEPTRPY